MNGESNLFIPVDLQLSRSTRVYDFRRYGTCMAGRLIPTLAMEILPGDSFKVDLNTLFKMSTPVYPTMDNLFADVFFFFVPYKLLLSRRYGSPTVNDGNTSWKAIIGAQDFLLNMPVPANGIRVPGISPNGTLVHSLADYFNLNLGGQSGYEASCLPTLAYCSIFNENFRDPNVMDAVTWNYDANNMVVFNGYVPLMINKLEDVNSQLPAGADYGFVNAININASGSVVNNSAVAMYPFPTCRFHSYLGSALPWPQRNSTGVELPLGDLAPVVTGDIHIKTGDPSREPLIWAIRDSGTVYPGIQGQGQLYASGGPSNNRTTVLNVPNDPGSSASVVPSNLYADLSEATAANVNALRLAIQQQRWYEKLARSGNRYDELKYGLFGVRGKDSGDDRPVYLGGKRIPLNIEMVASTNGGTTGSQQNLGSLGALGAFSHTNDSDHYFYHSFDDWGVLMCLFTIRHHTTVSTFHKRMWDRRQRDQFYFPTFAHLGEQSISREEITGDTTDKSTIFGYQQAWEEYRTEPNLCAGLCRPGKSLGFISYAETFPGTNLAGYLNASTQIRSIDQTLTVASYTSGFQFIYDFNFKMVARRCIPDYSVPGLMDHF